MGAKVWRRNIYFQRLAEETGAEDIQTAVERYVAAQIGTVKPRWNLAMVADSLNVTRICYESMTADGYLYAERDGSYSVAINRWRNWSRQRFTLAHELGHVLLHRLIPETRSDEHRFVLVPSGNQVEERLCDMIASELIAPRSLVVERYAGWAIGPKLIVQIAREFGMSLSAAAIRVRELWDCSSRDFSAALLSANGCGFRVNRVLARFEKQTQLRTGARIRAAVPKNTTGHVGKIDGVQWLEVSSTMKRRLAVESEMLGANPGKLIATFTLPDCVDN